MAPSVHRQAGPSSHKPCNEVKRTGRDSPISLRAKQTWFHCYTVQWLTDLQHRLYLNYLLNHNEGSPNTLMQETAPLSAGTGVPEPNWNLSAPSTHPFIVPTETLSKSLTEWPERDTCCHLGEAPEHREMGITTAKSGMLGEISPGPRPSSKAHSAKNPSS